MREIDGTEATAEYIGVDSPATMRYWRHVGEGPPSFKVGRRVLYRKIDVDRWVEERYRLTVRGDVHTAADGAA